MTDALEDKSWLRKKIKDYLTEVYDSKQFKLESDRCDTEAKLKSIIKEQDKTHKLREEVLKNIDRANEADLNSYKYLFGL